MAPRPWSVAARVVVSLLLVWHLMAVLIGPLATPPSVLASSLRYIFHPYTDSLDLNHGYKFFAPDPGPSHLIEYDLEMADGKHVTGTFPDRKVHWPRLLYHRHFMLTEFIANVEPGAAGRAGETLPNREQSLPEAVQHEYIKQQTYAKSYAEHLLNTSGAKQVTLQLVRHHLPEPNQVIEGAKLDNPASYVRRPLGVYTGERR